MIVDCMTCPVRGQGCHDCAVTVLLGLPGLAAPPPVEHESFSDLPLDAAESKVVSMFVDAGLVREAAATHLRACPERTQSWGSVRNVG
jgi:hypothetical protein